MAGMTSGAPVRGRSAAVADRSGWVTFAGAMLAMVGTLNIIYGIGAISDSKVYVGNAEFVIGNLNTWGWFLFLLGAAQVLVAFGVWSGNGFARWLGVGAAMLNGLVQLLIMPAFPFLSLSLFAIDLLVIYGLIAHGGEVGEA